MPGLPDCRPERHRWRPDHAGYRPGLSNVTARRGFNPGRQQPPGRYPFQPAYTISDRRQPSPGPTADQLSPADRRGTLCSISALLLSQHLLRDDAERPVFAKHRLVPTSDPSTSPPLHPDHPAPGNRGSHTPVPGFTGTGIGTVIVGTAPSTGRTRSTRSDLACTPERPGGNASGPFVVPLRWPPTPPSRSESGFTSRPRHGKIVRLFDARCRPSVDSPTAMTIASNRPLPGDTLRKASPGPADSLDHQSGTRKRRPRSVSSGDTPDRGGRPSATRVGCFGRRETIPHDGGTEDPHHRLQAGPNHRGHRQLKRLNRPGLCARHAA